MNSYQEIFEAQRNAAEKAISDLEKIIYLLHADLEKERKKKWYHKLFCE